MAVAPIPAGYHSVTPYLVVKGAADAIEFYRKACEGNDELGCENLRRLGAD